MSFPFKSLSRKEARYVKWLLRRAEQRIGIGTGGLTAVRQTFDPGPTQAPSGIRLVPNIKTIQVLWNPSSLTNNQDPVIYYEVQVSRDNQFFDPDTYITAQLSFNFKEFTEESGLEDRYYVRVRGVRRSGAVTIWSSILDTVRGRATYSHLDFNVASSLVWDKETVLDTVSLSRAPAGEESETKFYGSIDFESLGRPLVPIVFFDGAIIVSRNDGNSSDIHASVSLTLREDGTPVGDGFYRQYNALFNSVTYHEVGRIPVLTDFYTPVEGVHSYDVEGEFFLKSYGGSFPNTLEFNPNFLRMIFFEVV